MQNEAERAPVGELRNVNINVIASTQDDVRQAMSIANAAQANPGLTINLVCVTSAERNDLAPAGGIRINVITAGSC